MAELFQLAMGETVRLRGPDGAVQILTVVGRSAVEQVNEPLLRRYWLRDSTGIAMLDAEDVEEGAL